MPRTAAKVAISLPSDLQKAVERTRKQTGQSRSAVVQDALRCWLAAQHEAALVREYVAGYRRMPETKREVQAAEAAAVKLLASQEW